MGNNQQVISKAELSTRIGHAFKKAAHHVHLIQVRLCTFTPIPGIEVEADARDQAAVNKYREEQAQAKGINAYAASTQATSGVRVISKAKGVDLSTFVLIDLPADGYGFVKARQFRRKDRNGKQFFLNVLIFKEAATTDEQMPLPDAIEKLLVDRVFNGVQVDVNPPDDNAGTKTDSVQGFAAWRENKIGAPTLVRHGSAGLTYRIQGATNK